ncbi:MAG: rhomboid family intramembrane serine protease [Vulcanimicrobiaceae bacterium]
MSVTGALIALNVLAYLWLSATGNPGSTASLVAHGALYPPLVTRDGQWWRIVSGAFLHVSLVHIGLNMFALFQVGRFVEMLVGKWRTLLMYAVAMLGSGFAVVIFSPNVVTVGASGAIFGLFGALVAIGLGLGPRGRSLIAQTIPIIVLNLLFGVAVPNISNAAHLGGLVSGFLIGALVFALRRRPPTALVVDAATGSRNEAELLPPEDDLIRR